LNSNVTDPFLYFSFNAFEISSWTENFYLLRVKNRLQIIVIMVTAFVYSTPFCTID